MQEIVTRGRGSLRWGVEQRLEFIEFRLFWEGRMNRSDLMKVFGVSVNQASADLNRYLKMAPENMIYNRSARAYARSPAFAPLFLRRDADSFLNQLRSVTDGLLDRADAWIKTYPEFDSTPFPSRAVNPDTLQLVLEAVREGLSIEVRYQSLTFPAPRWRWIAPHAIGHDGYRWHLRAHCDESSAFKDFLLARIIETRSSRPRESDPREDYDWHEFVGLRIGPHPNLSPSQRQVIELDYGMQDGSVELRVRRALLPYTLKHLGLDRDPSEYQGARQQIVLLNRDAILADHMLTDRRESA